MTKKRVFMLGAGFMQGVAIRAARALGCKEPPRPPEADDPPNATGGRVRSNHDGFE